MIAALCTHTAQPADLRAETLCQVFQVQPLKLQGNVVSRHRHVQNVGVFCMEQAPLSHRTVSILECYTLSNTCPLAQAYELLRTDMPAEEVQLAAAAPGLLDAARARWAHRDEIEQQVRTCFHAMQHSYHLAMLNVLNVLQQRLELPCEGTSARLVHLHCHIHTATLLCIPSVSRVHSASVTFWLFQTVNST